MTVYIASDHIITSLGFSTFETVQQIRNRVSGIQRSRKSSSKGARVNSSPVDTNRLDQIFADIGDPTKYTRLERMAIVSVKYAIEKTDIDLESAQTLFIFASSNGNLDLFENHQERFEPDRLHLWRTAQVVASFFDNPNSPLVISCGGITGLNALITAKRLLDAKRYKHIVVTGGDLLAELAIKELQSLKLVSPRNCKPFDFERDGLTPGEGSGTIVLTNDSDLAPGEKICLGSGASTHDACVRTPSIGAMGLVSCLRNVFKSGEIETEQIDYISAHGNGTSLNDNKEATALKRMDLDKTPLNSLKGYIGDTMGAAGLIESAISIQSMRDNILLPTKGFRKKGTTEKIQIIKSLQKKNINTCLKLSTGHGGSNAAILLTKNAE